MFSTRWRTSRAAVRRRAGSNMLVVVVLASMWLVPSAGHVHAQAQAPEQAPNQPDARTVVAIDAADDAPSGQPVFRSAINFVRVDAIVTDDDGNPVRDLTIDDFEIFEDDLQQQVETFKLVEHTGEFDPALPPPGSIRNEYDLEREAAREDSRIFVFFLDD